VVAGAAGLVLTLSLAAHWGWSHFIRFDAAYFHVVAQDLDASDAVAGDAAYRYGRIGLPALARLLAAGSTGRALEVSQTVVTPVAFGLVVGLACAIAGRRAGRWTTGLVVLASPGLWLAFRAAWSDTLLTALVLASIWAAIAQRNALCVAALAAAVLTKEVGAIAIIPAIVTALSVGDRRAAIWRAAAIAPAAAWWAWVRLQSGEWPFLADEPARTNAIDPPFVAIVEALRGQGGDELAAIVALILGIAGLSLLLSHRREPLAWSAGVWGAMTLCLGDNVLRYPGDALRVMGPAMCITLLAARTASRRYGTGLAVRGL
jgi:hypothetical protein